MRAWKTRKLLPLSAGLLGALGCDWTQFDLEDIAPVVLLNPGDDVRGGFGRNIATATDDDRVIVLVGGAAGSSASAAYSLGTGQTPSVDASPGTFCTDDSADFVDPCFTANSAAAISLENSSDDKDLCFAYGWGAAIEDETDPGLVARCEDSSDITLQVDDDVRSERDSRFDLNGDHQPMFIAAEKSFDLQEDVPLVASLPNQGDVWYYPPPVAKSTNPVTLQLPSGDDPPETFGRRLAVARLGADASDPRLIAVSASGEGQLWLFRVDEESELRAPFPVGCMGSRSGFGRSLAAGKVDDDDFDDLVVAEAGVVTVFSGAALNELTESFDDVCGMGGLVEDAIVASFTCGSREALAGCDDGDFGASVAVGDLDGDGDGEVIVGAPGLSVFGESEAGGVLIYDAEGDEPYELSDTLYISSAEAGDELGTSVAAIRQDERDIIMAGAPGNGKTAIFFCNDLIPEDEREGRCAP